MSLVQIDYVKCQNLWSLTKINTRQMPPQLPTQVFLLIPWQVKLIYDESCWYIVYKFLITNVNGLDIHPGKSWQKIFILSLHIQKLLNPVPPGFRHQCKNLIYFCEYFILRSNYQIINYIIRKYDEPNRQIKILLIIKKT